MASTKITRTSATSSEKKLTISTWVKKSTILEEGLIGNTSDGANWAMFYFDGQNRLQFASYIGSSYVMRHTTNRKFNDPSAWYHLVGTVDVSLASPEVKIYVNGEQQTSLAYNITPSQNADIGWFTNWDFEIGSMFGGTYFNGSLSDLYYIQGYIYPASTFGETDSTTGEWKPKTDPTINYGGNGGNSCHLKFENSANMDLDSGSNNISFSTSGTLTQTEDCPDNVFATMNPLNAFYTNDTFSNGNNTVVTGSSTTGSKATFVINTGKFYWEVKVISKTAGIDEYLVGIVGSESVATNNFVGQGSDGYGYYGASGAMYNNSASSAYGASYTAGDILGIALDCTNSKLYIHKNGTYQASGNPSASTGGLSIVAPSATGLGGYYPSATLWNTNSATFSYNFGNGYFGTTAVASAGTNASSNGVFEYDVPTGYTALSTKGLNL